MAIDFGDLASRYANARLDRAMQPFTDPEAYLNNRLQQNYGVDLNGNVQSQTTTIQQNADGTGTVTTKHELGLQEQPQTVTQPNMYSFAPQGGSLGLQMPQQTQQPTFNVGQVPQVTAQPTTPQQVQAEAQLPQQLAQAAQPAAPQVTEQPPAAPTPQAAQVPNIGQLPTPGPGIQVATTGQLPAGAVANAPSAIQQPNQVTWQQELESAQADPTKLWSFTQNPAYPEEARKFAAGLYANHMDVQKKTDQALRTFTDAFAKGDVRAQNQIMRDLRRDTEEGSLIKAVLFARLGLHDMARQEQQKLGAGNKISRALLDGQSYATDTDANGFIKRAWDATGAPADERTLSRLNAESTPFGTHAFGFTGGLHTLSSGELLQPRTNSITGQSEFVYSTGPNKGKIYTGNEVPQPQRISTNAQVALNDAIIKFQSAPSTAFATEIMKLAAQADPGDGSEIRRAQAVISKTPFAQGAAIPQAIPQNVQQPGGAVTTPTAQPGGAVTTPTAQPSGAVTTPTAQPSGAVTTPTAAPITAAGAGGVSGRRAGESFDQYQKRLALEKSAAEAEIQRKKEVAVAEEKPPAEAKGKNQAKDINNQRYSDETYGLIKPISDAIKQSTGSGLGTKIDQLAGVFGVGTTGAQAKAQLDVLGYNLVSNVPRFEGAQSDRDVALYERAAGDIANSEKPINVRLAALNTIIQMLKKYDKAGKNDWTFASEQPGGGAGGIRIITRERIQ